MLEDFNPAEYIKPDHTLAPRRDPLHDIIDDILMYEEALAEIAASGKSVLFDAATDAANYTKLLDEAGSKLIAKADGLHAVLCRMEAQREAGTKERARIDARNRLLDAAQKRLKEYVLGVMDSRGVKDIHGETVTLTSRGATAKTVTDDTLTLDWHRCEITMPGYLWMELCAANEWLLVDPEVSFKSEPDKTRIGKALKTQPVPGAKSVPGRSLQRK